MFLDERIYALWILDQLDICTDVIRWEIFPLFINYEAKFRDKYSNVCESSAHTGIIHYSYVDNYSEYGNDAKWLWMNYHHCFSDELFAITCMVGWIDAIKWLVSNNLCTNFNINYLDIDNISIFTNICIDGYWEMAQLLLNKFGDTIEMDINEIFIGACTNGNIDILYFALSRGVDIRKCDDKGYKMAIKNNNVSVIDILFNKCNNYYVTSDNHYGIYGLYDINRWYILWYLTSICGLTTKIVRLFIWDYFIINYEIFLNRRNIVTDKFMWSCRNGYIDIAQWIQRNIEHRFNYGFLMEMIDNEIIIEILMTSLINHSDRCSIQANNHNDLSKLTQYCYKRGKMSHIKTMMCWEDCRRCSARVFKLVCIDNHLDDVQEVVITEIYNLLVGEYWFKIIDGVIIEYYAK